MLGQICKSPVGLKFGGIEMKFFKVFLTLIICCAIINFVRSGSDFALPRILPWCSGYRPGIYDLAAVVLLIELIWGISRLRRFSSDKSDTSSGIFDSEDYEDEEYDLDDDDV